MPKQSGEGDLLIVAGVDLSGDVGSLSKISTSAKLLDVTAINKSAHERIYGERDGEIAFVSFFNPSANQEHPTLKVLPTYDVLVTCMRGGSQGAQCANITAKQINYDAKRGADGSLTFTVQTLANGFGVVWGISLTAGKRTDVAATNGASINAGGAVSFGGQFYYQLISFVGSDITIKLQDSADNSTFADVAGVTSGSLVAPGSYGQVITSNTATIRQYWRCSTTTSGGFTSATFVAIFTRNEAAGVVF